MPNSCCLEMAPHEMNIGLNRGSGESVSKAHDLSIAAEHYWKKMIPRNTLSMIFETSFSYFTTPTSVYHSTPSWNKNIHPIPPSLSCLGYELSTNPTSKEIRHTWKIGWCVSKRELPRSQGISLIFPRLMLITETCSDVNKIVTYIWAHHISTV